VRHAAAVSRLPHFAKDLLSCLSLDNTSAALACNVRIATPSSTSFSRNTAHSVNRILASSSLHAPKLEANASPAHFSAEFKIEPRTSRPSEVAYAQALRAVASRLRASLPTARRATAMRSCSSLHPPKEESSAPPAHCETELFKPSCKASESATISPHVANARASPACTHNASDRRCARPA